MIKLKCHCGSEVEVDFSRAAVAYEKESNYIKEWLDTHKCKQTGGFITAPRTTDNGITLTSDKMPSGAVIPQSTKLPIIWCGGSGTFTHPTDGQTYTTINYNIQNSAEGEEPPEDISLKV